MEKLIESVENKIKTERGGKKFTVSTSMKNVKITIICNCYDNYNTRRSRCRNCCKQGVSDFSWEKLIDRARTDYASLLFNETFRVA